MSTISSLTSQQTVCLNRVVQLIARNAQNAGVDSAIQALNTNNCLGEELTNKILQIIDLYKQEDKEDKYDDLKKRVRECKSEQEAYKVLMPDEPHPACQMNLIRPLSLSQKIRTSQISSCHVLFRAKA
jgi:hypothetical protein